MMRGFLPFLFLVISLAATGCGPFHVEAGFKQPVELTATAEAKPARPSPTPKPQLGKLAFVKGGDIWAKDLPDGEAIRLTQDGHNDTPTWSPSGEWLALRKGTAAAGRYQLWIVRASGTDARSIDIVRSGMSQQMAWSPVEDRLAYVSRNGLFVAETDGTKPRELVTPSSQEGFGVTSLAWSPDGQWIAFDKLERTDIRPSVQGLLRAKVDGSEIKEVYLNPDPFQTQSYLAGWSPDGQALLFWQGRQMSASMMAGGVPLMWVPVAGGTPVEITKATLAHSDFLAWAPDARKLALVEGSNRSTWYRKTIAVATLSGRQEVLSDAGRADLFPAFSPDGQWIAFTGAPAVETDGGNDAKQASAQRRIWVMAANGDSKRQLTSDPTFRDERPLWSADGSFILFVRFRGEQAQLWLMRADGSEQRQVVDQMTPSPASFGYYGYVDWGQLFDWWRAALVASQMPAPQSAETMTLPAPTPSPSTRGDGLDAFLRAAAGLLERQDVHQLPEAAVASRLKDLAGENRVEIDYIKRSDGNPEAWVGWSGVHRVAFLLWRQGDKVSYQVWSGPGKDSFSVYLVNPVQMLRLIEKDGAVEMGLIPANIGSTGDAWFVLARLVNGRWQEVWSPARATRGTWAGSSGKVEFAGSGIDVLRLQGPIPEDVPASRTFDEFGVFLKQQYESEWRRQGDEYVRVSGQIIPTPVTTLADFLDRLQRGDRAGALRLVTDPALMDEALNLGLSEPASDRGWAGVSQTKSNGAIFVQFFDNGRRERSFRAGLVEQANGWRVMIIEKIAPELRKGDAATVTPEGDK